MKRIHAPRNTIQTSKEFNLRLIALALSGLSLSAQAADGLVDPGTLGGTDSAANGISADGSVVVGNSDITGDAASHAFRWTSSGGMTDLGTLGGTRSDAAGVSADGAVVVGNSRTNGDAATHAFRWTNSGGMTDLGTLGGTTSFAEGVSGDGAVVVGRSQITGNAALRAFRWTNGSMSDLGTLGGSGSSAKGVSADGAVVVGNSDITGNAATHAFRWTSSGGMTDLGTLGGAFSSAKGVSADGAVVVGEASIAGEASFRAFRWTSTDGMRNLGSLGGAVSMANGVSADGAVVVGVSELAGSSGGPPPMRAFRWTSGTGMQSVEDWLRAGGVSVPVDITREASATNADGSVVVGQLATSKAFIARLSSVGSGLVTLADVQNSLGAAAAGGQMALSSASTLINGAHSRPLARLAPTGKNTFWLAGDWGRDDHGERNGDLGLAEVGVGHNFGWAQLNASLGQTWAKQTLTLDGQAKTAGSYVLAEALIPVAGSLWATVGGYGQWGEADLRRSYQNAGRADASWATPDLDTWSVRARLDWQNAFGAAGTHFSPYVDLSYTKAKLDGYTETGGGFPARFDARSDTATEMRLGVNASKPLGNGLELLGVFEAAHRFESEGARTSGQMVGLFSFNLDGQSQQQNWLRAGAGVQGKLGGGLASLSLNATSKGEVPNLWLAANWQMMF